MKAGVLENALVLECYLMLLVLTMFHPICRKNTRMMMTTMDVMLHSLLLDLPAFRIRLCLLLTRQE